MSKPSSRVIYGFLRIQYIHQQLHSSKPPLSRCQSSYATYSAHRQCSNFIGSSNFSDSARSNFLRNRAFPTKAASSAPFPNVSLFQNSYFLRAAHLQFGLRRFSVDSSPKYKNFAERVFRMPAKSVASSFSRYREAIGLQIEAFLRRNSLVLLGAGGVLLCALLWKIMFGLANTFVGISEGIAKYGFLALSSAIVAFTGLFVRSRLTINPDRVYRIAMRMLNTHAGILEVMGAPLSGTNLRAYVMSGGGVILKKFKLRLRGKRCFLIFPIRGSERKGLVSIEVKKKNGQYDVKLLAVDIPMASGPDQRLFLVGDEQEYRVGGGLISELRDPVLTAMAATKEFDDLDEIEEEEDAERELEEAEKKHREQIERLEKASRE
ncbi:hypothetical protein SAY87_018340 [Trapa incisa]|uniref:Import inner membrane translocase subunit n=1 Tax=Trapa incisa TaxID=236973 RepID=A0AAN7KXE9_9MYRT|nr:hypothetical protein SAY87_018340 [Trapa incisa]